MKFWKCPECDRTHETKDNIKFVVCKNCLSSMKETPYKFQKEVESEE